MKYIPLTLIALALIALACTAPAPTKSSVFCATPMGGVSLQDVEVAYINWGNQLVVRAEGSDTAFPAYQCIVETKLSVEAE